MRVAAPAALARGGDRREHGCVKFIDLELGSWIPTVNPHVFRRPPREPLDRDFDYEDRFDFTTMIFDAFWSEDGGDIVMITPQAEMIVGGPFEGAFTEVPSGRPCALRVDRTGPTFILRVAVTPGTTALRLDFALGTYFIAPQPSLVRELAGERLLMCHSKDNALHWVRDWAYWYVREHGATGVLFYDNGSTKYSKYDIRAALATVPGLKTAVVIDARVPFGAPPGRGANDSKFFQRFYQEHAKYRLFARAGGLLHVDIDELMLSPTGESIFDAVDQSATGYLSCEGVWVERVTDDGRELTTRESRHAIYSYVATGGGRNSLKKNAIAPHRLDPESYFVTVHRVYGVHPDKKASARFTHRHMLGIKDLDTHPNNQRRFEAMPFTAFDGALHERDEVLHARLARVFDTPDFAALPAIEPYGAALEPDICRKLAGDALKRGDVAGAVEQVRAAIALAPERPSYHEFLARCLMRQGDAAGAAEESKLAAELWTQSSKFRVQQMRGGEARGGSAEEAEALVKEFPDDPDAWVLYADALRRARDPAGAEEGYRRASELQPDNPARIARLARHLRMMRRPDDALATFRQVVDGRKAGFGDKLKSYLAIVQLLEESGRCEEALATVRAATAALGGHHRFTASVGRELAGVEERVLAAAAAARTDAEALDRAADA